MVRYLVVTADDFGYCTERNRGIVAGYLAGSITRTSLLVTAAAAKQAAQLAAQHHIPIVLENGANEQEVYTKGIICLHFNVTEGFPVSNRSHVHSLLTESGVFKGKVGFRDAVSNGQVNMDEVKLELEAQLALFKELTGHLPLHVDGHNHVHVLPGVSSVFATVLRDAGVYSSRVPHEVALQTAAAWLMPPARMAFYKDVVKEASAAAEVFTQHGIGFSDGFVGMSTMGADMTVDRLDTLLNETYLNLAWNRTAPSQQRDPTANKDVHCDRLMGRVPQPSYSPQRQKSSATRGAETDIGGDVRERVKVESQVMKDEKEVEIPVRPRQADDSCYVTSSPCDKDKVGEKPEKLNDNDKTGETGSVDAVVELMVHPGYPCVDPRGGCGEGPDDFAQSAERSHELGVLCSTAWRTVGERRGLRLCAQPPTCRAG